MIIELHGPLSAKLSWLLRTRSDDPRPCGQLKLRRRPSAVGKVAIEITRADGSELSATEQAHVRGVLAAHRVEPIE